MGDVSGAARSRLRESSADEKKNIKCRAGGPITQRFTSGGRQTTVQVMTGCSERGSKWDSIDETQCRFALRAKKPLNWGEGTE